MQCSKFMIFSDSMCILQLGRRMSGNGEDTRIKNIISIVAGEGVTLQQSLDAYKQWAADYDKVWRACRRVHTTESIRRLQSVGSKLQQGMEGLWKGLHYSNKRIRTFF